MNGTDNPSSHMNTASKDEHRTIHAFLAKNGLQLNPAEVLHFYAEVCCLVGDHRHQELAWMEVDVLPDGFHLAIHTSEGLKKLGIDLQFSGATHGFKHFASGRLAVIPKQAGDLEVVIYIQPVRPHPETVIAKRWQWLRKGLAGLFKKNNQRIWLT